MIIVKKDYYWKDKERVNSMNTYCELLMLIMWWERYDYSINKDAIVVMYFIAKSMIEIAYLILHPLSYYWINQYLVIVIISFSDSCSYLANHYHQYYYYSN